jgi:hypothetical protein
MIPMLDYINLTSDLVPSEEELVYDYFLDYEEEEKEQFDQKELGKELKRKYLQDNWKNLLTKITLA